MLMDRQTDKNRQMNRWNNNNFESKLAMMNYLPVKFEFDWTKCFRVSPEMAMLTGSQRNGWNYTNFKSFSFPLRVLASKMSMRNSSGGSIGNTKPKYPLVVSSEYN